MNSFWRRIRRSLVLALTATAVGMAYAATGFAAVRTTHPPLLHMTVNLKDRAALRNGALYFAHQCEACHSIQGTRLAELAQPLGLSRAAILKDFDGTGGQYYQTITSAMPAGIAHKFFNKIQPPDLTVIAKRRSVDWLYTYLNSFYLDPSRPTGVNNIVFYNVSMPDILASLQGLQEPVKKMGYRFGQRTEVAVGVKPVTQGAMSPAQFRIMTRDVVSFLYYVAHPHQQEREAIGKWVLLGLAALTVLTFLLYKLYWRNVVPPEGGRWWRYGRK